MTNNEFSNPNCTPNNNELLPIQIPVILTHNTKEKEVINNGIILHKEKEKEIIDLDMDSESDSNNASNNGSRNKKGGSKNNKGEYFIP